MEVGDSFQSIEQAVLLQRRIIRQEALPKELIL